MDWSIKITGDFTPLVQSASKIVERIGDAVFCGRERKEVWKKALQEAQTEQDRQKILSGKWQFTGEKLVPCLDIADSSPVNAFLAIGQEQEVRNLAGNMRMALEAAQNVSDEEVAEGCIDPDWFARWRREAMVIGNEEMQRLWGRILVEEAKNPESVSYRTLDVLKNLTRQEAELFTKMGRWEVAGILPCFDGNTFLDFTYKDYIILADAGLLIDSKSIALGGELMKDGRRALSTKNFNIYLQGKNLEIDDFYFIIGFKLSKAGDDLINIINRHEFSKDDMHKLCEVIHNTPNIRSEVEKISFYSLNKEPNDSERLIYMREFINEKPQ